MQQILWLVISALNPSGCFMLVFIFIKKEEDTISSLSVGLKIKSTSNKQGKIKTVSVY